MEQIQNIPMYHFQSAIIEQPVSETKLEWRFAGSILNVDLALL